MYILVSLADLWSQPHTFLIIGWKIFHENELKLFVDDLKSCKIHFLKKLFTPRFSFPWEQMWQTNKQLQFENKLQATSSLNVWDVNLISPDVDTGEKASWIRNYFLPIWSSCHNPNLPNNWGMPPGHGNCMLIKAAIICLESYSV